MIVARLDARTLSATNVDTGPNAHPNPCPDGRGAQCARWALEALPFKGRVGRGWCLVSADIFVDVDSSKPLLLNNV